MHVEGRQIHRCPFDTLFIATAIGYFAFVVNVRVATGSLSIARELQLLGCAVPKIFTVWLFLEKPFMSLLQRTYKTTGLNLKETRFSICTNISIQLVLTVENYIINVHTNLLIL